MNYSTNYNLNKPERSEQFNIDHWNNNTDIIDSQMYINKVNIAQNATDITTLFTGLNTKNTSDTNSVFYKLMKLIYPVGSLYWSANNTNPSTLFGGTWTQIKDKFVLACGDTYSTTGATGGASSVTLAVTNLPSHNHSIGGSTGNTQPTFTGTAGTTGAGTAHSHGLNSHTHSLSGSFTTTDQSSTTTNSRLEKIAISGDYNTRKWDLYNSLNSVTGWMQSTRVPDFRTITGAGSSTRYAAMGGDYDQSGVCYNLSHTHSYAHTHKITLSGNTGASTGNTTSESSHTHSFTPSGTVSNHSHTLPANTGSKGNGTAFSIMPPYVVKYCWQRTA